MRPLLRACLLALLLVPAAQAAETGITVSGTRFVLTAADGTRRASEELIGAVLHFAGNDGQAVAIRIDRVEPDPDDKSGQVLLHDLSLRAADGSWSNLCRPGPDGRAQAFPVELPDGGFELTCTGGALAKCVRFGYRPWDHTVQGVPLASHYLACVRMVRADYCGGAPTTRDGMRIDLFDDIGINEPGEDGGLAFEAGWTPEGAVCVNHPRVPENIDLAALARTCPRLADRLGPSCTEDFARKAGALMLNRSAVR